jgi:hypothetical protein
MPGAHDTLVIVRILVVAVSAVTVSMMPMLLCP